MEELQRLFEGMMLDAAAEAWAARRRHRGETDCVCTPERDEKGLEVTIFY
jgi:hypothetical protein